MAEQQRNFEAMLAGIGQATEALGRVASQTATQQQQLTEAMQRLTEAASQGAAQAARNSREVWEEKERQGRNPQVSHSTPEERS